MVILTQYVYITKLNFLVNWLDLGFSSADRINTWLSCSWGCANVRGSNNVYLYQNGFSIYLTDANLTPELASDKDYVLHYEIEGTCDAN